MKLKLKRLEAIAEMIVPDAELNLKGLTRSDSDS
jgi:hypothetical protein